MTLLEENSLVPECIENSFQTIEEYSTSLKGLDLEEFQLSRGDFNGNSHVISSESFKLGLRTAEADHLSHGHIDENHIAMIFPLKDQNYIYNGHIVDDSKQITGYCNTEGKIFFPAGHKHYTVLINKYNLPEYLKDDENELFHQACIDSSNHKLSVSKKSSMTQSIDGIFKKFKYLMEHPCSLLAYKDCYDSLFYSLNQYYTAEQSKKPERISNRERLLARALDFIHNSDIQTLTVSELVNSTHASSRSLQYCFSELMGITPKAYLIRIRLNAIRKELLLSDPASETMTAIAHKYGVVNIGRFKQDYERFFNETPRETLSRR